MNQKMILLSVLMFYHAVNAENIEGASAGQCIDCDPVSLEFPDYLEDQCDTVVYGGGIAGWVALRCDESFSDITSQVEWQNKIDAGELRGRFNGCKILGEFPAPERVTKRRGACGQEETVKKRTTVTLLDSENDATFSAHDLYDFLDKKGDKFNFGFITCDGRFFGFFSNVTVEADEIVPQTDDDDSQFQAVFKYDLPKGVIKPVSLPFLVDGSINLHG